MNVRTASQKNCVLTVLLMNVAVGTQTILDNNFHYIFQEKKYFYVPDGTRVPSWSYFRPTFIEKLRRY